MKIEKFRSKIILLLLIIGIIVVFLVIQKEETIFNNSIAKEQVKCIFTNSNKVQECYSSNGKFKCYGVRTCLVNIVGEKGEKQNWKSTCEKQSNNIVVNGINDSMEFNCAPKNNGTKTEKTRCLKKQLFHHGLCKLKIINLSLDYNKPLSYIHNFGQGEGGIFNKQLFSFRYAPLVRKAKELVMNKSNTYDKVKAIANYVYNSKYYDRTFNPPVDSIKSYWNMDRGKCFHAAQLTQAMLNVVGIPALHYDVYSIAHAQTLINIDGIWGVIDTTFHKSKLSDPDREINIPSLKEMENIPLFITEDNLGMYDSDNLFCNIDNSVCMKKPFSMLRTMVNPKFPSTYLIIPTPSQFMVNHRYYGCELSIPYNCIGGCVPNKKERYNAKIGFSVIPGDYNYSLGKPYPIFRFKGIKSWDFEDPDYQNQLIGYTKMNLPISNLEYKYTCYRIPSRDAGVTPLASEKGMKIHPVTRNIFILKTSDAKKISWSTLEKTSEATKQEFNDVSNYLKSVTGDLGINP